MTICFECWKPVRKRVYYHNHIFCSYDCKSLYLLKEKREVLK